MDLNKYILMPLEKVTKEFKALNYIVEVINNNHNINGDTKLVTNIVIKDKYCRIYYGEFIFNLG